MHVDITEQLKRSIDSKSKKIKFDIKLVNHDEYNINHISISAVIKRPTEDVKYIYDKKVERTNHNSFFYIVGL